jgi:dipeptide/tripeptide permease
LVTAPRAKQNFAMAVVGGFLAAALGAVLWPVVTIAVGYEVGYMALGVGVLVGGVVRVLGRGLDKSFGWLGMSLSVLGCLLGNFLTNCTLIAKETDLSLNAVLAHLTSNLTAAAGLMIAIHPVDLLFYGVALYGGYRLSFRQLTETKLVRAAKRR